MITGDHAVTAAAIGAELDLGPGVITGPEFQRLTDTELVRRLPELRLRPGVAGGQTAARLGAAERRRHRGRPATPSTTLLP